MECRRCAMTGLPYLGMTKAILVLDTETTSPVDLKTEGQYRYWENPESRVVITSCRYIRGPDAEVYDHEARKDRLPRHIINALRAPKSDVMLAAANSEFDRHAFESMGFPTPPEKWIDILTCSYMLGFTGRLADVLRQTPIGMQKNPEGTRCITEFSVKQTPWYFNYPLWEKFVEYGRNDAVVEARLLEWLLQWLNSPGMIPQFQKLFSQELIYRRANGRGIPIDLRTVRNAIKIRDDEIDALVEDLKYRTGLENPNSVKQLLEWCRGNGYLEYTLGKEYVTSELDRLRDTKKRMGRLNASDSNLLFVLEARAEIAKTSTKKFDTLAAATSDDGYFRGGWAFFAASRTGRVGGRGLNPANLARPKLKRPDLAVDFINTGDRALLGACFKGPVMNTLSSCIRACLKAHNDEVFTVVDLSSIESVGGAWLTGCRTVLDLFHTGKDQYRHFYSTSEGVPYDAVTDEQRTFAKPAVLGCLYGLSGFGLVAYAAKMGVTLEQEKADHQVTTFRNELPEFPHYWYRLVDTAAKAIENPGSAFDVAAIDQVVGHYYDRRGNKRNKYSYKDWPKVSYFYDGTFLFCRIPSGRCLAYYEPKVSKKTVHKADGTSFEIPRSVSYMGTDRESNAWQRIHAHGGLFLENINQAMCRDILWEGVEQIEADDGLTFIGDVYDEPWTLSKVSDTEALARLVAYSETKPSWLTDDFYLHASGYSAKRYKKG